MTPPRSPLLACDGFLALQPIEQLPQSPPSCAADPRPPPAQVFDDLVHELAEVDVKLKPAQSKKLHSFYSEHRLQPGMEALWDGIGSLSNTVQQTFSSFRRDDAAQRMNVSSTAQQNASSSHRDVERDEISTAVQGSAQPLNVVTVEFHLSTFQEVAPLTRGQLRAKASEVRQALIRANEGQDELASLLRGVEVDEINEDQKPFLPRCQDLPTEAFLEPERAAELFDKDERRSNEWQTSNFALFLCFC